MPETKRLTDTLSVGPQPTPDDIADLAAAGFRSLVVNRPDGEEDGQPSFHEIRQAAEAHGLEALHIPVVPEQIGASDVTAMSEALDSLPKPVFGYCRTGKRATQLWALSEKQKGADVAAIKATAKSAGYDVADVLDKS